MAKRNGYYVGQKTKPKKEDKHAYGNQCVYCGKKLDTTIPDKEKLYAQGPTRLFPVCSEECRLGTEAYVEADKTHKPHFYWMFLLCGIMLLAGALLNKWWICFPGMCIGGLAFLIFPYAITSFDSFLLYSIKGITRTTRIIGFIILAAGIFFTTLSILGITEISFY